jgi:hypothetical protein
VCKSSLNKSKGASVRGKFVYYIDNGNLKMRGWLAATALQTDALAADASLAMCGVCSAGRRRVVGDFLPKCVCVVFPDFDFLQRQNIAFAQTLCPQSIFLRPETHLIGGALYSKFSC